MKPATRESSDTSAERYYRMIDEVQDYAIIFINPDGVIEHWNKGAQRIKGYSEQEAIGKNFRMFYTPEDQQRKLPEELLNTALTEGKAVHEGYRVRKDGSRFWGSILITAVHDNSGNVIGFSKVTRDLTELKAAYDDIKMKNQQLEKMNHELSAFAYVSSHDLQEPLRKIKYFSERIREEDYKVLSEKSRDYFARIMKSADRLRALIDDLLAYSRINNIHSTSEPTDLNAVIRAVLEELSVRIEETGAMIEVQQLPVIEVIPFQMHQLFLNLISNSLKFLRPQTSPRIIISCDHVNAGDNGEQAGKPYYRISVEDNGVGFSNEYADRIFEVFQRLHDRSQYDGTGVGLSICRKIAENHGGFIQAEGRPGSGATFSVCLPVTGGR